MSEDESEERSALPLTQTELHERLQGEVGLCFFSDLSAHIERGVVLVVDDALDLVNVAVAVASDDAQAVTTWIEQARMAHPSPNQVEVWRVENSLQFRVVIVRPYVLVQPLKSA
jgi:hypothetical protein